jgi:hypothetical protein
VPDASNKFRVKTCLEHLSFIDCLQYELYNTIGFPEIDENNQKTLIFENPNLS